MSSPSRVFAVLSLFTHEQPLWHTDDINTALGYTRATGYRYVKHLVQAGFLQKVSAGRYALGARIIELDYHLRHSDPVLLAALPVMNRLFAELGFDVVLSSMFGGTQVIDTSRIGANAHHLQYGRGRPRRLWRGAAPKAIMAFLPRSQLQRIHQAHAIEFANAAMGHRWEDFHRLMRQIRRKGIYVSHGELDPEISAAAVPLLDDEGEVLGALSLVGKQAAMKQLSESQLHHWLSEAASKITSQIGLPK